MHILEFENFGDGNVVVTNVSRISNQSHIHNYRHQNDWQSSEF